MKQSTIVIIGIICAISLIGFLVLSHPPTKPPVVIPPVEPPAVKCDFMCYDILKNYSTKGYDPKFLAMPVVKISCVIATNDGATLGFCDKNLGTL